MPSFPDQIGRTARRLLSYLIDHMNRPEYQVRFSWRNGSVAMWDNRVTQHYAVADYLPAYRCMHRVTVVDDGTIAGHRLTDPDFQYAVDIGE